MMDCTERLISEYIDGELPTVVARALEDHLRTCAECRAILSEYRSLIAATQLLAAQRNPIGHDGRTGFVITHRNEFGQAQTSDLLA